MSNKHFIMKEGSIIEYNGEYRIVKKATGSILSLDEGVGSRKFTCISSNNVRVVDITIKSNIIDLLNNSDSCSTPVLELLYERLENNII